MFLTVKDIVGTSLFLPSTTPTSNQPVSTTSFCSPCLRSTVGPLQLEPTRTNVRTRIRPRTEARIRAILEHSHLDPLQSFFAWDLPGQKRRQIGSPQANKERARIGV